MLERQSLHLASLGTGEMAGLLNSFCVLMSELTLSHVATGAICSHQKPNELSHCILDLHLKIVTKVLFILVSYFPKYFTVI